MRDQRSHEAAQYRALYKTARWQRLRLKVLTRDRFTCQRCGKLEARPKQIVVDHATPHRGDQALFWSEDNLQAICKPCHDGPRQEEERTGQKNDRIGFRCDVDSSGKPTDPNHPWNR